ncbi:MAG TPA: NAD(P)H-dependent oxidoreductase [Candidatus Blautia faecipullorum]|nr:NAD(P)H-dependent oxidoreductase [Candidatus Blautia faecipullorum]
MKKFLSVMLTLTMVFTFAACGNGGSESSRSASSQAGEQSSSTAPDEEASSEPQSSSASEENPATSESTDPVESSAPDENAEPVESSTPAEGSESDESSAPTESALPAGEESQPETEAGSASLVVYFSWSGNTESVANEIQAQTGADIFEIVPAEPYTDDYNTLLDIAQEEQADGARPAIADTVENFDQYDVVYFGYPNWWYGVPMALLSFLENNDLSGKQIYLFYSHGTGGLADSVSMITEALPGTEISDHIFDCYEEDAPDSEEEIGSWLAELGYSG